jgi:hypothetical protein
MDERALATYLNDHLAGSTAGLWTATRLIGEHRNDDIGHYLLTFRDQVIEDREVLRSAIRRLPADESIVKRTAGALAAALVWTRNVLPLRGTPSLLEDLESLAIGVWGKRLLWGSLARVSAEDDRFADVDVERLAKRAEEQERELLRLRDEAIRTTLDLAG